MVGSSLSLAQKEQASQRKTHFVIQDEIDLAGWMDGGSKKEFELKRDCKEEKTTLEWIKRQRKKDKHDTNCSL